MAKIIMNDAKILSDNVIKKSLFIINFLVQNSWIPVTVDSAPSVPIAAPNAPYFGIKIELNKTLIAAPAM